MGVYIKGIEMPKDNCEAIRQITITNNWIDGEIKMLAHDSVTNEFIGEVVEVKEPHGRLIDAHTERIDRLTKIIMWLLKRYYESLEKTFEEELKQVDEILKPVRLMDLIYAEQCKAMPKPLYEYGFGDEEREE